MFDPKASPSQSEQAKNSSEATSEGAPSSTEAGADPRGPSAAPEMLTGKSESLDRATGPESVATLPQVGSASEHREASEEEEDNVFTDLARVTWPTCDERTIAISEIMIPDGPWGKEHEEIPALMASYRTEGRPWVTVFANGTGGAKPYTMVSDPRYLEAVKLLGQTEVYAEVFSEDHPVLMILCVQRSTGHLKLTAIESALAADALRTALKTLPISPKVSEKPRGGRPRGPQWALRVAMLMGVSVDTIESRFKQIDTIPRSLLIRIRGIKSCDKGTVLESLAELDEAEQVAYVDRALMPKQDKGRKMTVSAAERTRRKVEKIVGQFVRLSLEQLEAVEKRLLSEITERRLKGENR